MFLIRYQTMTQISKDFHAFDSQNCLVCIVVNMVMKQ